MTNLKTLLKRLKYNTRFLINSNVEIPSNFRIFERRNTNFHHFILKECIVPKDGDREVDLNKQIQIFGKFTDKYEISNDIFTNYDFSNKKLKPAFFNIADVKVPYEASRLQYLQKAKSGKIDVNKFSLIYWNSPMDVAIRNINLIFHLFNIESDRKIAEILGNNTDLISAYISQHYEFIINNLENKGNVVGNHYLIELTSILLTIATFNFESAQEDWQYYQNELLLELNRQFYEDGTSFEGSSHYSVFVTEALILCRLAIEEMDKNSVILQKIDKIIKSNYVFLSKLMNKGELSQIGDNDSGRLFYYAFDEDAPLKMNWFFEIIKKLYQKSNFFDEEEKFIYDIKSTVPSFNNFQKVAHRQIKVFTKDYQSYCFKDFGIYIWRNDDEYFSVRCGPIGQNGIGGHSHYDQLSIECFTGNSWILRDPGTGTYTDDIDTRNKFRSLDYHWGPKAKIQFPKEDEFDCFKLNYMSDGEILQFDKYNFLGFADFNGKRIYRKIVFDDGEVSIEDFSNNAEIEPYTSWGEKNNGIKVKFSNGYKRIS